MAAPTKIGLDYFPFDVSFFDDEKVTLIRAQYGEKGEGIILRLLCSIYKQGYYLEWSDKERTLFIGKYRYESALVDQVITAALKWSLFDNTLFKNYGALSSAGIQRRYFEAVRRRRSVKINADYMLVSLEDVSINGVIVDINGVNVGKNPVNESKVNQSKKSRQKKSASTPTQEKVKYADYVSMTKSEHGKLVEKYGTAAVYQMIEKLDNHKGARGAKYKSDYRAILSWVVDWWKQKEEKRNGTNQSGGRAKPRNDDWERA